MRTLLLGALLCIATGAQGQGIPDVLRVDLSPVPGFGPFYPPLGGAGPAGDPIGGPRDLSGHTVSGVPDTLTDIDLRFLNFQWAQGVHQALAASGSTEAEPPPGTTTEYIDQQVHYLVGRDSSGAFVWIVDSDNDEDLADETSRILPWDGPRMTIETFRDSILSGPDPVGFIESMPSVEVSAQVFDGEHAVDITRKLYLIPFLVLNYPSLEGPQPRAFYWVAFDGHYSADFLVNGQNYRIWLRSASRDGLVEPSRTHIRVKKVASGDTTWSEKELESAPVPFALGDVVELGGSHFRLDDVDLLGRYVSMVKVGDPKLSLPVGTAAPVFSAVAQDGSDVSMNELRGRHILLGFQSTRNTSFLGILDSFYPNYNRDCMEFVTILDDDANTARLVDYHQIAWPLIADKELETSIQALYGISNHPTFVLVDPDGRIAGWEAVATYPLREDGRSIALFDQLKGEVGASCLVRPTPEDIDLVLAANPIWTTESPWYVADCSFTADDVEVISITDEPGDHGWPVKLGMSGTCVPRGESDRVDEWHEEFRLNTILYRSLGKWALTASDPFVEN